MTVCKTTSSAKEVMTAAASDNRISNIDNFVDAIYRFGFFDFCDDEGSTLAGFQAGNEINDVRLVAYKRERDEIGRMGEGEIEVRKIFVRQ